MNDTVFVRMLQCARNLACDPDRFAYAQPLFALQLVAQRFAADVRHDVEQRSLRFTAVDEPEDVRMEQLGRYLDLAEETSRADRRRQVLGEDLDGYLPVMFQIAREIDRGHGATADLALDCVASAESGAHSLQKAG